MGPDEIIEIPDMGITMSDGTRLSARVWMPRDACENPVPAIVEYLPYRKRDGTVARDALTHPYFASHGYACLRVDIRGNGDSQGVMLDEYTTTELDDGVTLINWIAAQEWCSGTVGVMGISWGGFNGLQLAERAPKPLKAVITLCSTVDRFNDDIHYKGGCMLGRNLGWGATMFSYSSRAPDPVIVGDKWRDMWLERLNALPHLTTLWAQHQHRDAYWKHGSVCQNYPAIKAATLAVGGWGDAYKNAVPALVKNLDAPAKGIIGPWIHKYPHFAVPEPRIGFLQEALRWWDRWLKGRDTGVEADPDLRLYLMDSAPPQPSYENRPGRWVNQNFRDAPHQIFHLGDGRLLDHPAQIECRVDCPADTGMAAGEYCAIWGGADLPEDQAKEDLKSMCFDGDILTENMAIVGAPVVRLTLRSDTPVAQIALRLNDVFPDGKSARITYGVLNLCHREDQENPSPMPPGLSVEITVRLDHIAYEIPAGHRLRLSVSNAYWPLIWPSPGASALTLSGGQISMPLLCEMDPTVTPFAPAEAAPAADLEILRAPKNTRKISTDPETGMTTLEMLDDFGAEKIMDHGMIVDSIARETWSIHPDDPLSARVKIKYCDAMSRDDWSVRTETQSEMWSDATDFYITARVAAFEGDQLIFEKEYSDRIKRDLL